MPRLTFGTSARVDVPDEVPIVHPHLLLVGNPNVGKSVLFGCLTRRYVTVSNYPGTTVEITRGSASLDGKIYQVLDTPGTNQLTPMTPDERVTRDIVLEHPGEPVVQVADAKNLRRALVLTLSLGEVGAPVTLALNMQDEARGRGVAVRRDSLEQILGIPVVETVAIRREGVDQLERAIPRSRPPVPSVRYPPPIEHQVGRLVPLLESEGPRSRFLALELLAGAESILPFLRLRLAPDRFEELERGRQEAVAALGRDVAHQIQVARLQAADEILGKVQTQTHSPRPGLGPLISHWALHPFKGVLVLAALLYLIFWFVGLFGAGTLVDLTEQGLFGQVINPLAHRAADAVLPFPHQHSMERVSVALEFPLAPGKSVPLGVEWSRLAPSAAYTLPEGIQLSGWQRLLRLLHDLLVGPYGAITMALSYGIAIVLPIVTTFFLVFSLLEDSGYLPRLAVMVNNVFKAMGLNGKAVLPMVLGLGCDTMATMTTRILETRKQRLIVTLLLALGVPCSAQLGVILAMMSHVSVAGTVLWIAVITGVMVAVGYLASKLFPGQNSDFLMELPPIRRPVVSNIMLKSLARIEWYLREVVPLFFLGTGLLFVLDRANALGAVRELASPVVVHWLGLPREMADAFLVGFLRRDYGAVFLLRAADGPDPLLNGLQVVVSMIVITLFIPCIANVFIIVKEHGWKIALGMVAFIFPFAFLVGGLVRMGARIVGAGF